MDAIARRAEPESWVAGIKRVLRSLERYRYVALLNWLDRVTFRRGHHRRQVAGLPQLRCQGRRPRLQLRPALRSQGRGLAAAGACTAPRLTPLLPLSLPLP